MQNQVIKYVGQRDDAFQQMILIDHNQPMNLDTQRRPLTNIWFDYSD